jgi:hypothetical protein
MVRTLPFHGANGGSNPSRATKLNIMKTITKTLPTGIKTVQKKRNGIITITVADSKTKPKTTKAEKYIVTPIALFAMICVVSGSLQLYSTMSWTELLVLSPVILFTWAVFTAVIINFYLLIFKS